MTGPFMSYYEDGQLRKKENYKKRWFLPQYYEILVWSGF